MHSGNEFLEEFFTCPICMDVMEDPSTTECGHNFCIECIKKNKYECAICRRSIERNLTVNYGLKKTIESIRCKDEGRKSNSHNYFENKQSNNLNHNKTKHFISNSEKPSKFRIKRLYKDINLFNETEQKGFYNNNEVPGNAPQKNEALETLLNKIMMQFMEDPQKDLYDCSEDKNQFHPGTPSPLYNNYSNININFYNFQGSEFLSNASSYSNFKCMQHSPIFKKKKKD